MKLLLNDCILRRLARRQGLGIDSDQLESVSGISTSPLDYFYFVSRMRLRDKDSSLMPVRDFLTRLSAEFYANMASYESLVCSLTNLNIGNDLPTQLVIHSLPQSNIDLAVDFMASYDLSAKEALALSLTVSNGLTYSFQSGGISQLMQNALIREECAVLKAEFSTPLT